MAGSLEGVVCGNIGVGAVGSYWTRWQRRQEATVMVYDVNQARAQQVSEEYGCEAVGLDTLLANSDWISTALLPLSAVHDVLTQIGERKNLMKQGALLLDHSGVKTGKLNEQGDTSITSMLKATEGREDLELIALHLAFRPDVEFEGQNVYVSPVKPSKGGVWLPRIMDMMSVEGAKVYQMSPERQDIVTMRHQMIIWGSLFAAFEAMRRSGSDMSFAEMEQLTTKLSEPFFGLMGRMVSGNPEVYWQTMLHHPRAIDAMKLLGEGVSDLASKLERGAEAGASFADMYNHLRAIAESGSPERKTGKQIVVEIYYEADFHDTVQRALNLEKLEARGFSHDILVSTIPDGWLTRFVKTRIPIVSYVPHKFLDRRRASEIAFYARHTPHPEHPERRGTRFSSMIPPDLETRERMQQNLQYTRVQLTGLHNDPIVNFFLNVARDPALSVLRPFVVYNTLA